MKELKFLDKQGVIDLMKSSKSLQEWRLNCNKVKQAYGGDYPDYWYQEIILSGLCDRTLGEGSSKLKITAL